MPQSPALPEARKISPVPFHRHHGLSKKQFAKFSAFRVEFLRPPALTFAMKRQDEPQGKGCGQWLAAGINPVVYSNGVNSGNSGSLVGAKMSFGQTPVSYAYHVP